MFQSTEENGVLALSLVLAVLSAYATLELAGRPPRKQRRRRVWCLATGILLVAGTLAAALFAKAPFFRFIPYHFSAVLPVILAAVVASWIVLRSLKGKNPDQASAIRFQTLAEAIPQIVWIADSNGRTSFINKRWYEMTGTQQSECLGVAGWKPFIPMTALLARRSGRNACARARRSKSSTVSTMRPTVIAGISIGPSLRDDQGAILQWFGTCTDIEDQKHYQQILEQQIEERTEELADANTRLQQEMWEKDLARRTLDEHNDSMSTTKR
jgi:PAS domain S-box-containing protein